MSDPDIPFTAQDWDRTQSAWTRWWNGALDRPLVLLSGDDGSDSADFAPSFVAHLPLAMPAEEVVDRYHRAICRQRWYGDAFPKWWPNFGPGIMSGFLGGPVEVDEATVWFESSDPPELAEIELGYDEDNIWWRRVRDLTACAVDRWSDRVAVAHSDLGGNLDILAALRGSQNLLIDLIDQPELVERHSRAITRLWLRYYDELHALLGASRGSTPWAPIWSPERCYMLQCDFSYMISPEMFVRHVLPDLEDCCRHLDHGFYHLDGPGQIPHLDILLGIERLRGIQWIPGAGQPGPGSWLELLARIKAAGKLCQVFVSAEDAMRIVAELGGRGFALAIGGRFDATEADDLLAALAAADRESWEARPRVSA